MFIVNSLLGSSLCVVLRFLHSLRYQERTYIYFPNRHGRSGKTKVFTETTSHHHSLLFRVRSGIFSLTNFTGTQCSVDMTGIMSYFLVKVRTLATAFWT